MLYKYFLPLILISGILLVVFGLRIFIKTRQADRLKKDSLQKNPKNDSWGIRMTAAGFALIIISLFHFLNYWIVDMIIIVYFIGILFAIGAVIFGVKVENKDFREKVLLKIKKSKYRIPFIKHWDEVSILRQIQQRLILAGIILVFGFGFVLINHFSNN